MTRRTTKHHRAKMATARSARRNEKIKEHGGALLSCILDKTASDALERGTSDGKSKGSAVRAALRKAYPPPDSWRPT